MDSDKDGDEDSGLFRGIVQAPEVSLGSGSLVTSIPIVIPPGRKSATPELKLLYSSAGGDGPFGLGWTLPLGMVQRNTQRGVPRCIGDPATDEFVLTLPNGATELVHWGSQGTVHTYHAKIDEAYVEVKADTASNSWEAHDRTGLTYRFGGSESAIAYRGTGLQGEVGPGVFMETSPNCRFTSVWALTQVEDPNGNTIDIAYAKENNVLYPSSIAYGGNLQTSLAHPFRVSFQTGTLRPDPGRPQSYGRGYRERLEKLVDLILVEWQASPGSGYQPLRTYTLSYDQSQGRSLLESISGTDLPTQWFEYSPSDSGVVTTTQFARPSHYLERTSQYQAFAYTTVMDMNGDGFADYVNADNGVTGTWSVSLGTGQGFATSSISWTLGWGGGIPSNLIRWVDKVGTDSVTKYDTFDLTGDGVPDFIDATGSAWVVYRGSCSSGSACRFLPGETWNAPNLPGAYTRIVSVAQGISTETKRTFDMNADGRPDLVIDDALPGWPGYWGVFVNTGTGFALDATHLVGGAGWISYSTSNSGQYTVTGGDHFDFNGDGLPDEVVISNQVGMRIDQYGDPYSNINYRYFDLDDPAPAHFNGLYNARILRVRLNTGRGFGTNANPNPYSGDLGDVIESPIPYANVGVRVEPFNPDTPLEQIMVDFMDVNGDGLPDLVNTAVTPEGPTASSQWRVLLNRGGGRLEKPSPGGFGGQDLSYSHLPSWAGMQGNLRCRGVATCGPVVDFTRTTDVFDWNGDGLVDRVRIPASGPWQIDLTGPSDATGRITRPFLLTRVHNGAGGVAEARYEPSTRFVHEDSEGVPTLPFVTWVATATRQNDGLCDPGAVPDPFVGGPTGNPCIDAGHEIVKTFTYEGGLFDPPTREFRGFRGVSQRDVAGTERRVTFSQDDVLRGKVLEERSLTGPQDTVRVATWSWVPRPDGPRTQVYLAEHRVETFSVPVNPAAPNQCVITRNEPPDPFGRVGTQCTLSCEGAPPTPGSCANLTDGQVDTVTEWADPISSAFHVRERPAHVLTRYKPPGQPLETLTEKWFQYDGTGPDGLGPGDVEEGNVKYVKTHLDQSVESPLADPVVRMQYDAYGNVTSVVNPRGFPTSSTFATASFSLYPVAETNALSHVVQKAWDLRYGQPLSVTDENGNTTEYGYDGLGRLLCEARPGDAVGACQTSSFNVTAEYSYHLSPESPSNFEELHSHVEIRRREPDAPNGYLVSKAFYDALGRSRFTKTQQVVGDEPSLRAVVRKQVEFDKDGRLAKVFAPYVAAGGVALETPPSAATTYDYLLHGTTKLDPLGRVHRVDPPDATLLETQYEGVRTTTFNARGGRTISTADFEGREVRKEVVDNGPGPAQIFDYTYDGAGRLLTTTTGGDPTTTVAVSYDTLARKVSLYDPDSGPWAYGYDAVGNLIFQDNPRTYQHVQICYDALDRITLRFIYPFDDLYDPGACTSVYAFESSYEYDDETLGNEGIGRLTRVDDVSGSEQITYDTRGRVTKTRKEIQGITAVTEAEYNLADRAWRITYPDGEKVTYSFNAAGHVKGISGTFQTETSPYLTDLQYDVFGRPETVVHGNGAEDRRSYFGGSQNHRLATVTTTFGAATYLNLAYGYNNLGKVEQITDGQHGASTNLSNGGAYTYDTVGRLTAFAGTPSPSYVYDFDTRGNLKKKDNKTIQYTAAVGRHKATSYSGYLMTYDFDGNRTWKGKFAGWPTFQAFDWEGYTYDWLGRLMRIERGAGAPVDDTIEFTYDYSDRRVLKTVDGGSPLRYFSPIAEYSGGQLNKYYFAGDLLIATRVDNATLSAGVIGGNPSPLRIPREVPLGLGCVIAVLLVVRGRRGEIRLGVRVTPARAVGASLLLLVASVPAALLIPSDASAAFGASTGTIRHYHLDHLGSTQELTDANGALVEQVRYRPYGDLRGPYDGNGNPIPPSELTRVQFTGYETEHISKLQYAGARFYDPELGQFQSHDPQGQFASPYAYGPWDPVNGTDPTGEGFLSSIADSLIMSTLGWVAVIEGIRSGDVAAAFIMLGVQVAVAAVASFAGPLTAPGMPILAQVAGYGLQAGMAGYSAYSTVQAARRGDTFGAVLSGINFAFAAYGLGKGIYGALTSEAVSGQGSVGITESQSAREGGNSTPDLTDTELAERQGWLKTAREEGTKIYDTDRAPRPHEGNYTIESAEISRTQHPTGFSKQAANTITPGLRDHLTGRITIYPSGATSFDEVFVSFYHEVGHFNLLWTDTQAEAYGRTMLDVYKGGTYKAP